uniref:Serine protease n=1 Tax=Wifsystermes virus TaxID=2796640 RepID=A0A7T7GUU0_9VIRU|nr:hypothetical protein [Wifsystermes virus]
MEGAGIRLSQLVAQYEPLVRMALAAALWPSLSALTWLFQNIAGTTLRQSLVQTAWSGTMWNIISALLMIVFAVTVATFFSLFCSAFRNICILIGIALRFLYSLVKEGVRFSRLIAAGLDQSVQSLTSKVPVEGRPIGEVLLVTPEVAGGLMSAATVASPEARIPGSDWIDMRQPEFQAPIYRVGNRLAPVCHGVRIGDYFVFPHHGVDEGSFEAVIERDGTVYAMSLHGEAVEVVPDLLALPVHPSFPIKKARVCPPMSTMAACTAGTRFAGSTGSITDEGVGHDSLAYRGSTHPGHSGAAYFQGKNLVGIHMGSSCGFNIGYSAEFVKSRMERWELLATAESSDFAFLQSLSAKRLRELGFHATGDPQEWEIKVGGRFFRVSDEEREELLRDERQSRQKQQRDWDAQFLHDDGDRRYVEEPQEERQALRSELKELRAHIRRLESAIAAPSCEYEQPDVDPVEDFSLPENIMGAHRSAGYNVQMEPRTSRPGLNVRNGTSSALISQKKKVSFGPQVRPPQSLPASKPTASSANQQESRPVSLRKRKRRTVKLSSSTVTASVTPAPPSTSIRRVGGSSSTEPLPASIRRQVRGSGPSSVTLR